MSLSDETPTIEYPLLNVRFGGLSNVPNDCYRSFDYICDEDEILPRCIIRLNDKGNQLFKSYWGLETGSKVEIVVTEGSATSARLSGISKKFSCSLGDLAVAAVYSNETNIADGADGILEIKCIHPWEIFQDLSAHAYSGKANSEIIKGIIENSSTRGFGFNDIDDSIFTDTDEDGNIPRYKCGEGDLSFIVNKLLPYTTINNLPVCFFIDDKNNVHLETFQSMFAKDAKLLVVGGNNPEDVTDDQRSKAATMNGGVLGRNLVVKVGNEDPSEYTKIIKREVAFDDPSALTTFTGKLLPKIAIGKFSTGTTQSGYIPISAAKILTADATDKVYYRNHCFKDLKAIALNDQKPFNSFFKVEIDVSFCGHLVSVGDNVELDIPINTDDTLPQKFWLSGKWHLKAIKYRWEDGGVPRMTLVLIRPSFTFSELTTTLMNPTDFYAVGTGVGV